VKKEIEEIAKQRLEICKECFWNSDHQKKNNNYKTFRPDYHCTNCGCDLHLKTRALSSDCPLGKWKAELSQEEEYELIKKLDSDSNTD
jgi:hypothetical protein